ncbi:sensor histidine kinase [Allokutzneria oryzae]|uniref:histidine kinase n=1 Tax=Allokutzneria oryzae TaxID=1378989 RepID=A0ABV5ZRJ7_9PSEU
MRRSLLTRLLAASILVAVCSITATAWLASQTTTGAIKQEQGRLLANDSRIYTALSRHAATTPNWAGVGPVVRALAEQTGRRIALLTQDRTPIFDSAAEPTPVPATASAVVDPLAVDPALVPDASADRIDANAVGPFLLPDAERARLRGLAEEALTCVLGRLGTGSIVEEPSGRPRLESPNPITNVTCSPAELEQPTPTERAALTELNGLVNGCLRRLGQTEVEVRLDRTWKPVAAEATRPAPRDGQPVRACIASARHEQLIRYVSPAALLFITSPSGSEPSTVDLSPGNQVRIVGVALTVLALTIAVTVLAGRRLIRPLRALTGAAQRVKDGGGARVEVRGRDEIAQLASAFNEMSETRERLEELRKTMVGDIAHELRTPLSNIRGWLEAIQDGMSDPDPALVAELLEEALLLQHIIDDLQDLSLADAGALRMHPETVRVADVLPSSTQPEGVQYTVDVPEGLEAHADPVRLRQAVGNLVANALRHTPTGGTVAVRARRDGDEVVIEVSDTGVGIAAEDLPHVFERFWRVEKSRGRQGGGSGLGLAIVRKLAEAHGGTVTAASTLGQGSTFTLRLPCRTTGE